MGDPIVGNNDRGKGNLFLAEREDPSLPLPRGDRLREM
jgi:hypothetical protein